MFDPRLEEISSVTVQGAADALVDRTLVVDNNDALDARPVLLRQLRYQGEGLGPVGPTRYSAGGA